MTGKSPGFQRNGTNMAAQPRKKSEETNPIDVTEAVKRAATFLAQVFADPPVRDIRLEEVEFLDDDNRWLVTLSFLRLIPEEELSFIERQMNVVAGGRNGYRREYKSVDVDVQTGKTRSIKMRSPV
jgi:hypothetical protein